MVFEFFSYLFYFGRDSIFCDFWEWISEIGKLSERLDYRWLVKSHRDYRVESLRYLEEICRLYPKLELIDSEYSHNQLIDEGVDLVLTVYGTIGFEYAYRGIKVINASLNNPHIGFNFNSHPSSKEEWAQEIEGAVKRSNYIPPDKDEVCIYYYLRNMHDRARPWLSLDSDRGSVNQEVIHLERLAKSIEDGSILSHSRAYNRFVESQDFRFRDSHYNELLAGGM